MSATRAQTGDRIARDSAALQRKPRGAEFQKIELHVHTPTSDEARWKNRYDFKSDPENGAKSKEAAERIARRIIKKCNDQKLRLVAVTYCNTPSNVHLERPDLTWYEPLQDAAREIQDTAGPLGVLVDQPSVVERVTPHARACPHSRRRRIGSAD